jgi:hypothetical protein
MQTLTLTLPCSSPEIAQQVLKHYAELNQHSSAQESKPLPADTPQSTKAARAPRTQPSTTAPNDQQPSPPSLEIVRARLAAVSQAGKTAEVKALLQRFGVDRLTALAPENFAELLAEAETL